jgi:crotonobetainyl-CoA:carnitine CoA-transferase CaiB-like acyl-CoA transferase
LHPHRHIDAALYEDGALLDISQREIASFMIGEEIVAAAADPARRTSVRRGSAQDGVALRGCYRCADGRWVAVTLNDAADEASYARAIAGPLHAAISPSPREGQGPRW